MVKIDGSNDDQKVQIQCNGEKCNGEEFCMPVFKTPSKIAVDKCIEGNGNTRKTVQCKSTTDACACQLTWYTQGTSDPQ